MSQVAFEVAVIFLLLIANGVFAMAEIAVVSSKKARLRRLADQGSGKARMALELAESPNRFLSTVQIGITLAAKLAGPIGQVSFLAHYADKIAFGIVVAVLTYFSLVLGELVPKRFGLSNPEGVAMMVARPMNWLSNFAGPVVSFLSVSTEASLRLLGFKPDKEVAGVVSVKAIYANLAANVGVNLRNLMTPPLIVPESQTVLQLVETFKGSGKHIALVTDEFGSIVGLVTLNDVMEAVVGEFPTQGERAKPEAKKRDDGSCLIDAMIDLEAVEKALPGFKFGGDAYTEYQTLAGFVVKTLGHVPKEGETFEAQGYVFEVLDMDRHRVDKVLVLPSKSAAPK